MSEIAQGNVGSMGHYDVKFEAGKLVLSANAALSPVAAKMEMSVDALAIKEAIKKAIPGIVDDMVLDMLFAALIK